MIINIILTMLLGAVIVVAVGFCFAIVGALAYFGLWLGMTAIEKVFGV